MTYCPYCGNALQFREAEICPKCGMRINERSTPRPDGPVAVQYIGFWTRLGAYLIDFVILIFIAIGVLIVIMASFPGYYGGVSPAGSNIYLLLILLIEWVYFTLQESSDFQGTVGKRLVKIKVIDNAGNKINFWQAALRNILRVIPFVGFFCVIVIGFSEKKQGLHDMAANTYVVPI
jgi:uncharacterized RDD family membrane protein YckC